MEKFKVETNPIHTFPTWRERLINLETLNFGIFCFYKFDKYIVESNIDT